MKRDLGRYLLKLDRWIDSATCDAAVSALADAKWKRHEYSDGTEAPPVPVNGERELDVTYEFEPASHATIMRKIVQATRFYAAAMELPWLAAPKRHSVARYNRYARGQMMLEHCDHIRTLFEGGNRGIPILSCLLQLNDDYEGGDLVFWQDETIDVRVGTMLVFPSNFLFPHRVEPVVSGLRYSCVSWAW